MSLGGFLCFSHIKEEVSGDYSYQRLLPAHRPPLLPLVAEREWWKLQVAAGELKVCYNFQSSIAV